MLDAEAEKLQTGLNREKAGQSYVDLVYYPSGLRIFRVLIKSEDRGVEDDND